MRLHVIIIIIGVTGAGKTTVGRLLARELGWEFYDADDLHPTANIEKMIRGQPLNDEDRMPWLKAIQESLRAILDHGENAIMGCSALKESYRKLMRISKEIVFVYLKVALPLVEDRLKSRTQHFMNPNLVKSQFDTFEEPGEGLQVDASLTPAEIVRRIRIELAV